MLHAALLTHCHVAQRSSRHHATHTCLSPASLPPPPPLQGVFFNFYLLSYILSPRTCHSLVGYLEEEAVKTYTHAIKVGAGLLGL
jgi:hypothetical protein